MTLYTAHRKTEHEHIIRFLDSVFGIPMCDGRFARKCIEYGMHKTRERREFINALYAQAMDIDK